MSRRARLAAQILGSSLLLSGCAQAGGTEQGQKVHGLYVTIVLMAAPVFVAVEALLIWSIVRYRARGDKDATPPQTTGTTRTLVIFFIIPSVIVAALFGLGERTLASIQKQDPNPALMIRAEGFQWEWTFYYLTEGFFVTGKTLVQPAIMVIPVSAPVHFELTSRDVIHSFFVPGFLFKRDAIPGRTNTFTITATKLGTYQAQCAEFCGLNHPFMTFVVEVVTTSDYLDWVKEQILAAQSVTCDSHGNDLSIVAEKVSWNTNCMAVEPGSPVSLAVTNNDGGIDHNFAIYDSFGQTKQFFQTGRFPGVDTRSFSLPTLPPGRYYFQCDVHGPSMSGVFLVGKPAGG